MSPVIVVDNEYLTVQYLRDKRIIYHTIHKPLPDQSMKDAMNAGTEALRQYGACKWLSDDRKNGPVSRVLAEWGFNDWNPRTIAAGWKYWANVVPEAVVSAGALLPVMDDLYKLGLRMMVFTDLQEAFEWLGRMKG